MINKKVREHLEEEMEERKGGRIKAAFPKLSIYFHKQFFK